MGTLTTDLHARGLLASRPAAGHAGREYYATDTSTTYRDNGTSWDAQSTGGIVDPTTTRGDLIVRNNAGALTRLALGGANTVLHGSATDPSYSAVVEGDLSLSDVTTANVATTKHGFAPKLPNDATKYLDGTGAWSTPAGGGGGSSIPEQELAYPTSASGDDDLMASTAGWSDVGANAYDTFSSDGKVLTLVIKGASKTATVRKTLGTTKAAAYDFRLSLLPYLDWWAASADTTLAVYLKTSGGSQLAALRFAAMDHSTNLRGLRIDCAGSGAFTTSPLEVPHHSPVIIRITRDGSDVVRFYLAVGSTPFALLPVTQPGTGTYRAPITFTSAGTVARVEVTTTTPSGPSASAEYGAKLDYFQSA